MALIALTPLVTAARAAEVPFAPEAVISGTPQSPRSLFAADIDGDGDLDAVSGDGLDNTIRWHRNDGGGWATATIDSNADAPRSLFAADIDGDGDVDVLSAPSMDDTIAWYENTAGNGSAWTARNIRTDAGGAWAVSAADVDGDGDLDVLAASYDDDTITWHENDGTPRGVPWEVHQIAGAPDAGTQFVVAPYFLERADYTYQHHRHWTHQSFGDKLPSDVFREHIIVCFIDDLAGVRNRDLIGVDTITWECDYPHSDSTWPHAPERLWEALAGVPDDEIDQITHRNAMRHFQYDPFAHRPRQRCTVATLRAEATDVDLTLKRGSGGIPPSAYEHGFVTVGDLLKQLSTTYATPAEDAGRAMSAAEAEARVVARGKNLRGAPPARGGDDPAAR